MVPELQEATRKSDGCGRSFGHGLCFLVLWTNGLPRDQAIPICYIGANDQQCGDIRAYLLHDDLPLVHAVLPQDQIGGGRPHTGEPQRVQPGRQAVSVPNARTAVPCVVRFLLLLIADYLQQLAGVCASFLIPGFFRILRRGMLQTLLWDLGMTDVALRLSCFSPSSRHIMSGLTGGIRSSGGAMPRCRSTGLRPRSWSLAADEASWSSPIRRCRSGRKTTQRRLSLSSGAGSNEEEDRSRLVLAPLGCVYRN